MPRDKKGKQKLFGDWRYSIRLRRQEQTPLLTTKDGVRDVLHANGICDPIAVADWLTAIDMGTPFASDKGLFVRVHRREPIIEERLRDTAVTLQDTGHYSSCWWHPPFGVVWWSYDAADRDVLLCVGEQQSNFGEIRRRFMLHKEVREVRLIEEAVPDLRRDPVWVEVFPCRV